MNVEQRRARWTAGLALALIFALPASSGAGAGAAPGGEDPRCSAVTKARPGKTRNVVYRVRCNFEVEQLSIQTNRRVYVVQRRPRLDNPDRGDRLACRRGGQNSRGRFDRRLLRCNGTTGAGVRVVGAFKVNGNPCALRAHIRASGGVDGEVVPDIGYFATVHRRNPRGC